MITYEPKQICVGLLRVPTDRALEAARTHLENAIGKAETRSILQPIDWRQFFESDGLLYDMKRFQIAVFPADSDLTVYVCNLADGWVSLFGNVAKSCGCDAFFFRETLGDRATYKVLEMIGWRHGIRAREVRVLQDDDGWKFVNVGDPYLFERTDTYENRVIKARLTGDMLESYAKSAGFPIRAVAEFGGPSWRLSRI